MSQSPVLGTVELPSDLVSEIRTGPARRSFLSKFNSDAALREHMRRLAYAANESRRAAGVLHEQNRRASEAANVARRARKVGACVG